MSMRHALSEARNLKIMFNDAVGKAIIDQTAQLAMPIDAYKAALELVAREEGDYRMGGSSAVADKTSQPVLVTGAMPFQIHVFELTSVMATGDYTFIYVETVPSPEDVS